MASDANEAARARSFDSVAAQYAAARPSYPPELFDVVEELAGRTLASADVLDSGAGTGIATRQLRERGSRVTALEPGAGMAAELHRAEPDIPLVRGEGNRLPFAPARRMPSLVAAKLTMHTYTAPSRPRRRHEGRVLHQQRP